MAQPVKAKPKPFETDLARKMAQQVHRLTSTADCIRLHQMISDRRKEIYEKIQKDKVEAAWAALQALPKGTPLMREPAIASWDLPIGKGERCTLEEVHVGRKHKGFWIVPASREKMEGRKKFVWAPFFRATSFVPYVEPTAEQAKDNKVTDQFMGVMNGLMAKALGGS